MICDQYLSITVTATANNIISMGSNISRVAEDPGPDTVPTGGHRLTAAELSMNEPSPTIMKAKARPRHRTDAWSNGVQALAQGELST